MSFAYLPLYTGDYRRDTAHLDCAEHGIYLLLLMHCWDSKGPIPLDERKQAGICGARSGSEIEALRRVLREFFVRMDDGWYNRRIQRELERAEAISGKRKLAGRKGFQAKAKHLLSKSRANASIPTPIPILPLPLNLEESKPLASRDQEPSRSAACLMPLVGGKHWAVDPKFLAELELAYPAVDGPATLLEIRAWCLSNPTKCKTERGVRRFINRWFERTQNA